MKQRFYIDTSVWGGVFDKDFMQETGLLFEMVKREQAVCLYSDITEEELMEAPVRVWEFFDTFPDKNKEKVNITPEIQNLAKTYVTEKVVGKTSFDDCLHIAAATIHRADLLVSWNFKHIVNVFRIRGYNAINLKLGYPILNIHSPKEIVNYGNDNEA
jgi:predicted nucleic acid-binding protein